MKEGFSKLNKNEKIDWVIKNFFNSSETDSELLKKYWTNDSELQQIHDEFSENTISNFFLPLGIAPNFIIDKKNYTIPMATEESSVVAAACKSAKFWLKRGGFRTEIIDVIKTGQVHFKYNGSKEKIFKFFNDIKCKILNDCSLMTKNMVERGGGILNLESGFPYSTIRELMRKGHRIQYANGPYGGYQAIKRAANDVYWGASESRKDGQAAGF